MSIERHRIWIAMVLTPLLTPAAFIAMNAIYDAFIGHATTPDSITALIGFAYAFGLPVAAVAMFALGWPWVAWLRWTGRFGVPQVCTGASVMGAFVFVLFARIMVPGPGLSFGVVRYALIGTVLGCVSGLLFCAMARVPLRTERKAERV